MIDYIVKVFCEESENTVFVHFNSEYPIGSVGFFEDMYEEIEYHVTDFVWRVIEFEEGF